MATRWNYSAVPLALPTGSSIGEANTINDSVHVMGWVDEPFTNNRLSPEHRSWNMGRIRGRDTMPERSVRSALHRAGFRFTLHSKQLPGRPDIVLPKYNAVVFVHGCYWHQHKGCTNCTTPTGNRPFWLKKFGENVARDRRNQRKLKSTGWKVFVVWECEVSGVRSLARVMRELSALRERVTAAQSNEGA